MEKAPCTTDTAMNAKRRQGIVVTEFGALTATATAECQMAAHRRQRLLIIRPAERQPVNLPDNDNFKPAFCSESGTRM